jgi:tetratricopeptide (TPR) repeat protein
MLRGSKHLSTAELGSLHDDLALVGRSEAYRHLLFCEHCRNRAIADRLLAEDETWEEPPPRETQRTARRAIEVLEERLEVAWEDREQAEALCERLLAEPPARQALRASTERRLASPVVATRLVALAEARCGSDPRQAEHLASLVATIAERLPRPWSGLERESLLAQSGTVAGEARRVLGELTEAEAAFQEAYRHLELLPFGVPERAEYCRRLARLRRDQGRDEEAAALIGRAADLFGALPDMEQRARCLIDLGWMLLDEVEPQAALPAFEEAAASFRSPERFAEWLSARHGLAVCYADLHCTERVESLLEELRGATREQGAAALLRVVVAEAGIAQALDDNRRAAALLAPAWPCLAAEGALDEALAAAFDLARIYTEEEKPEELARLKAELASLPGLPRPLADVISFALGFAAQHGIGSVELLEIAKSHLSCACHNPRLPFSILRWPAEEISWDLADAALRTSLATYAGVSEWVTRLGACDIPLPERQRIAWTAEAALGIRLVFPEAAVECHAVH